MYTIKHFFGQEKKAREANRFHAQLLNTMGQAAIATDNKGKIIFWNKTAEKIYGWTADEMMGKKMIDILPNVQAREQSENIMQQLLDGKPWAGEVMVQNRDGTNFLVFATGVPIYDQQYRLTGVIGVSNDITERKKTEDALQVSDARYRKAQLLGKIGNWELNIKTDHLIWSDEVYRIFGVDKITSPITFDKFLSLIHPDDLDAFKTAYNNVLTGKNKLDFSHRIALNDGTVCFVHQVGELEYNTQGELICLTGTVQDISQQKRSEIKLRDAFVQQLLFASIVNSSNDAIISKTLDGIITSWNHGAETIFDFKEDMAIGQPINIIIPAELLDEEFNMLEKIKRGAHVQHYETERRTRNGMRIKMSLTISPIYNASGMVVGASTIARNITEKKQAELQLVESEEKYRLLFEKSPQPMWIFDTQTLQFLEVNQAAIDHYGYSRKEFLAMNLNDVRPVTDNTILEELSNPNYRQTFVDTSIHKKKGGEIINVQVAISAIKYENKKARLALLIDRTDQEKARKDLLQLNTQLRELTAHLQIVREEERTHIAREIHDELGQQLSALKMDVEWLCSRMTDKNAMIEEKVTDLQTLIRQTVNSVRRISGNLRPAVLDDWGLIAALEWQSTEAEKRAGLSVHLTSNVAEVTLPNHIATGLFRIYQEALTNVIRHSQAKVVNAEFIVTENNITMQVTDDGKGFAPKTNGIKTFGLLGMKERAFILNGDIEILSPPGKGTTIMVSIPHNYPT